MRWDCGYKLSCCTVLVLEPLLRLVEIMEVAQRTYVLFGGRCILTAKEQNSDTMTKGKDMMEIHQRRRVVMGGGIRFISCSAIASGWILSLLLWSNQNLSFHTKGDESERSFG